MDTATKTETRCEVLDQIVEWTDQQGRLNVGVGDLVLDNDQLKLVSEITFNRLHRKVYVQFDNVGPARDKDPAAPVAVRRYVETTEE